MGDSNEIIEGLKRILDKERIHEADQLFKNSPESIEVFKVVETPGAYRDLREIMAETDKSFKTSPKLIEKYKQMQETLTYAVKMKVFYCDDFYGVYPGGSAAVVVAANEEEALSLLDRELKAKGLRGAVQTDGTPCSLRELELSKPSVVVLQDGNY